MSDKEKDEKTEDQSSQEEEEKVESSESEEETEKEEEDSKEDSEKEESEEETSEDSDESEDKEEEVDEEIDETVEEEKKSIVDEISKNVTREVTKKVDEILKKKQPSKAAKSVKKKIMGNDKLEKKIKIYTTKAQKNIEITESNADLLKKWFLAIGRKRGDLADKFYNELETKVNNTLVEGTAALGGNLVPTVLLDILVRIQNDRAVIRPRATIIDLSAPGATFNFNQIGARPAMRWGSEAATKDTTSMDFSQDSLTPKKLQGIMSISMELLEDSQFNALQIVITELADAVQRAEERAFMVGTGGTQPSGIDATVFPLINAQFSLDYNDFLSAMYRLTQQYRDNAVWIMNSRTIAAALGISDSNNRPIIDANGSNDPITNRPVQRLLGYPILEQNDLASSKIFFGDLSTYFIGDKKTLEITTDSSATVAGKSAFEDNLTHIRAEKRIDGAMSTNRSFVEISNTGIS